jgi:hypothetical protein
VSALDLPEPWACRSCGTALVRTFVDLGSSPPCEAFLTPAQLVQPETTYPLRVYTCSSCLLVQLPAHVDARDVFDDYAYFSSFSDSWVEHARVFVDAAVARLGLGPDSLVVEVASNDGYLLQHVLAAGVRALGVEAADNVAQAARDRGVPTVTCYLDAASGERLAASTVAPTWWSATTSWRTSRTCAASSRDCGPWSATPAGSAWSSRTCCAWSSSGSTTRSTTSTTATSRCARPARRWRRAA